MDVAPRDSGRGATAARAGPSRRSTLRTVAVPTEHGGWGLTAEPAVLGLLVEPSLAGLCIAVAAFVAFVARTPLKVLLVDRARQRHSDRHAVARRVLAVEAVVLAGLVAGALASADGPFLWPVLVAAPLVVVELWFDMRSRSRRLVPELAGSVGIASVVAMIVLAGGGTVRLGVALWLVLAGRAVTSLSHVRAQVARIHGRPVDSTSMLLGDLGAVALVVAAEIVDPAVVGGAVAVVVLVVVQRVLARGDVPPAKVLGLRQMAMGAAVVLASLVGVHLS